MSIFYILTIIIGCLVFLGLFIYIFLTNYKKKDTTYPPIIQNCPDNWIVDLSGRCIIGGVNGKTNIGSLVGKPLYFYSDFSTNDITNGYSFLSEMSSATTGKQDSNGNNILCNDPSKECIKKTGTKQVDNNNQDIIGYYRKDIPFGYDYKYPSVIDFNDSGWGSEGDPFCKMQSWSKNIGITWDGLNQYKCR